MTHSPGEQPKTILDTRPASNHAHDSLAWRVTLTRWASDFRMTHSPGECIAHEIGGQVTRQASTYICLPYTERFDGHHTLVIQHFGRAHSTFAAWAADRGSHACGKGAISDPTLRRPRTHVNSDFRSGFRVDRRRALSAPRAQVVRHVHCHPRTWVTPEIWAFPHGRLIEPALSARYVLRDQALASPYKGASVPLAATVLKRFPNRSATVRRCLRIPGNSGISREASRKATRKARHRVRVLLRIPSGCHRECSGIASVSNCDDQFSGLHAVTPRHTKSRQMPAAYLNEISGLKIELPELRIRSRALSPGRPWVVPRDVPGDVAGTRQCEHETSTVLASDRHGARAGVPESESINSGDQNSRVPSVFGPLWAQQQPPYFVGVVRARELRPLRPVAAEAFAQP